MLRNPSVETDGNGVRILRKNGVYYIYLLSEYPVEFTNQLSKFYQLT